MSLPQVGVVGVGRDDYGGQFLQLLLMSQHIILALIIFCPSNRHCMIVISGSFQEAARSLGTFVTVICDDFLAVKQCLH
jgi:hypothetical protein